SFCRSVAFLSSHFFPTRSFSALAFAHNLSYFYLVVKVLGLQPLKKIGPASIQCSPAIISGSATKHQAGSVENKAGLVLCCAARRSEEHTSELQSRENLVCRLPLE